MFSYVSNETDKVIRDENTENQAKSAFYIYCYMASLHSPGFCQDSFWIAQKSTGKSTSTSRIRHILWEQSMMRHMGHIYFTHKYLFSMRNKKYILLFHCWYNLGGELDYDSPNSEKSAFYYYCLISFLVRMTNHIAYSDMRRVQFTVSLLKRCLTFVFDLELSIKLHVQGILYLTCFCIAIHSNREWWAKLCYTSIR